MRQCLTQAFIHSSLLDFFGDVSNSKPETGVMLRYVVEMAVIRLDLFFGCRQRRIVCHRKASLTFFILICRDGSEVLQDARSGNILAEILIQSQDNNVMPVVATFASPWRLGM